MTKKSYSVTRQQVVDAALELRGWRFQHQGRGEDKRVDCVGFLYVVLKQLKYPKIFDVEGYKHSPSATVIYDTLKANFNEIPLDKVGLGDIFLMRLGGRKAKHASILIEDQYDVEKGIEPRIIHAYGDDLHGAVVVDDLASWRSRCITGFRLKGLKA